jgi:CRISPR-associated protein Cas1
MATLYLTEQGTTLRKEQNRLVVERDGATLSEIHDFKVERVVVFGNVQLTTQAMSYLLDRGIDTALLSLRGRLKGRLAPLESKNVLLRVRQYERAADRQFALEMARAIVVGKIANCGEVLARHQRNHPETDFSTEVSQLAILTKKAARTSPIESLRGIEGQAAAVYFEGFRRMLRRGMLFSKRTRRPPKDPVNSLLSFGYALMFNESISALVAVGFDPYIGFYHGANYGRCSLALDLMEEMRPVVADRLALNVANREVVKADDFTKGEDGGVYLDGDGRKRFLREYERMMCAEFTSRRSGERTSFRRALHEQALAMQRTITQEITYQPFQGWH